MTILIKIVERPNPRDLGAEKKKYAIIAPERPLSFKNLLYNIEEKTTLTITDVKAVVDSLIREMIKNLMEGKRIKAGDLGTFFATINTEGVPLDEPFTVDQVIGMNIRFLPSIELKEAIGNVKYKIKNNA